MFRVPNFVKNYTIECANSQKVILLGMLFLCTRVYIKKFDNIPIVRSMGFGRVLFQ